MSADASKTRSVACGISSDFRKRGQQTLAGIGDLSERYRAKAVADGITPDSFVFQQKRAPDRPLWDSGVRDALHQAAEAEQCDFPGLGPHSFRRANITWRQQVGGSAIMTVGLLRRFPVKTR